MMREAANNFYFRGRTTKIEKGVTTELEREREGGGVRAFVVGPLKEIYIFCGFPKISVNFRKVSNWLNKTNVPQFKGYLPLWSRSIVYQSKLTHFISERFQYVTVQFFAYIYNSINWITYTPRKRIEWQC